MELQSRATVFVAIAGVLAMLGGIILYAELDKPGLEQAVIYLHKVELIEENTVDRTAKVSVSFMISNPSEKTFTVPLITYDLYADGVLAGSGAYSTEDIAMPGRAAFYSGAEIPLTSKLQLARSAQNAAAYDAIVGGQPEYSASGIITVETAWSIIEKEF